MSRSTMQKRTAGRSIASHIESAATQRSGFTLVELMVSVALVLLMMLLFTEMFQMFSGAVATQQGVAENNERTRTLSTTIKADLNKRTMRLVVPFGVGERYLGVGNDIDQRRGYFSISENNAADDTDDVLRFTVLSTLTLDEKDETPYVGRSEVLGNAPINGPQWEPNKDYTAGAWVVPENPIVDSMGRLLVYQAQNDGRSGNARPPWATDVATATTDNAITWAAIAVIPNQPDSDDGVGGNASGTSPAAEVVYFLRGGTLYRRVMLIRNGQNDEVQPTDINGNDLLTFAAYPYQPIATPARGLYFRDFDYSAHYAVDTVTAQPVIRLNGFDTLSNRYSDFTTNVSLGMPYYRYGHLHRIAGNALSGRPREYAAPGQFIGGFTHEETSHPDFDYPRAFDPATSPMTRALTLAAPGRVTLYTGGPRRAEDILMTNVRSFDVKLWDNILQEFVDIGNNLEDRNGNNALDPGEDLNGNGRLDVGMYHSGIKAIRNNGYIPIGTPTGAIFDTWHPQVDMNGDGIAERPPFRPATVGADGAPGIAGVDDDGDGNVDVLAGGVLDYKELGASGSDDVPIPVRAIQITVRFEDPTTEQLRQISIVHSLVSESGI